MKSLSALLFVVFGFFWLHSAQAQSFNLGETGVLPLAESGSANVLASQQIILTKPAIARALTFYVARAAGTLRMAIYDEARRKIAETAELTAKPGWLTATVNPSQTLKHGTYWIAFLASDGGLEFRKAADGSARRSAYAYGPLPATLPASATEMNARWSFYATFNDVPPPRATITSSVATGATLSGSVSWTADVSWQDVAKVEFLIDSAVQWTQTAPPYQFMSSPGGMLDTTTLANGPHVLAVRATTSTGRTASAYASVTVDQTKPATTQPALSAPSLAGFPDVRSTGVPTGVTLTPSEGMTIDKPGTIISGLDIKGAVVINAPNVTLQQSRITSANYFPVRIMAGGTGAVVQDCEINGLGAAGNSSGIFGSGTFLRNNIYGVENGIALSAGDSVIQDNYIHDLLAPGSPHYDGIQIDGSVANVVIRHNTVVNDHGQTSAIMIDNYFGPISNISVDGNYLAGGGFTIYVSDQSKTGPVSGVSITNNVLQRGQYGFFAFYTSNPTVSDNVDGKTGRPIR